MTPRFCLTSDIDWASDWCISQLIETCTDLGIRPTLFATHRSSLLADFESRHPLDVGLHPNFLPASTHGNTEQEVISHLRQLFPRAVTFRNHCFFEHSRILSHFVRLGFRYDSNLALFLQPHIVPLHHASGLIRFPVFWEDDVHWERTGGDWQISRYIDHFLTPGLKILNVHPFFFAANIPTAQYYHSIKPHISLLSSATAAHITWKGHGVRTFVTELLASLLARGAHFMTLDHLFRQYWDALHTTSSTLSSPSQ